MYKLLLDSDALIKISKAEFLEKATQNFSVSITKEVYDEVITEGKKRFYQDAYSVEKFVNDKKIEVLKKSYKRKKLKQSFGAGETSIFQAYRKNSLIITDDLSFTSYIKKEGMTSISSAHLLVILFKKNKISKGEAYYSLEKLKPYIRREIFEIVRKEFGG